MAGFSLLVATALPVVDFCAMVRAPERYFDKPVVIEARYEQASEGAYLSDARCPLAYDDQIGVGRAAFDSGDDERRQPALRQLSAVEYGNRADVRVSGVLRNVSLRAFAWYRYRFDIARFERIAHVIERYEGELQLGTSYRTALGADVKYGLAPVEPVRVPSHYDLRLVWANRSAFPALRRLRAGMAPLIVAFSVIRDDVRQVTERRWGRVVTLKILAVE